MKFTIVLYTENDDEIIDKTIDSNTYYAADLGAEVRQAMEDYEAMEEEQDDGD